MKRLIIIVLALLLSFMLMGYVFTDSPNYQPLSFKYMIETFADLDFSFYSLKQWWTNFSYFVEQFSVIQTDPAQLLNPLYWASLIANIFSAPINLIFAILTELFKILNNLLIIFNRLIMVV